jgi:phosphatidate cytidylyltransferase
VLVLSLLGASELVQLLERGGRPLMGLCLSAVGSLVLVNWIPHLTPAGMWARDPDPWHWILGTFTAIVLVSFLVEMAVFQEPGESVARLSRTVWIVAYLGLLPSFLVQLRWIDVGSSGNGIPRSTLALALAVFVPKCCDIGAYFTGRLLGRHRLAPILSPKKTWEGAAGGLLASVLTALAVQSMGSAVPGGHWATAGFGLTVGVAGLMGDLAESLIKRDCRQKDASQVMPGFGGVLDVVDSIIFAAPVAYWWLR